MLCKTCLVFEIKNSVLGWTYTAQETTTKLAITVMLTYCALVLAHIIYSTISGVSSTAWDSVAELVALAMNSSPSEILQNTCAGIIGRRAYQTQVRVLKTSEKHLELVFGKVKDPNADVSELIMNEKYGSIAGGKDDEAETLTMEGHGGTRTRALSIDGYLWSQRVFWIDPQLEDSCTDHLSQRPKSPDFDSKRSIPIAFPVPFGLGPPSRQTLLFASLIGSLQEF